MSRFSSNGIVIVGAGPHGLSVAAHLRRHGLPSAFSAAPCRAGGRACRPACFPSPRVAPPACRTRRVPTRWRPTVS